MARDDLLLQIGVPEAWVTGDEARIDVRTPAGTLLATGRLAAMPTAPLERLRALQDALVASHNRDAMARTDNA
jgi:hypothetical protein